MFSFFQDEASIAALFVLPSLLSNTCYQFDVTSRKTHDSEESDEEATELALVRKRKLTSKIEDYKKSRKKVSPMTAKDKLIVFVPVNTKYFMHTLHYQKYLVARLSRR